MMEERNQYGISLQSENDGSCVVAELPEGRNLIDYCCKMLENNAIPGLLPVRHQILNGQVRLRYSLAGKVRLGDYLAMHPLTYANGLLILRNLTNSLLRLNEYFLRFGCGAHLHWRRVEYLSSLCPCGFQRGFGQWDQCATFL